MLIETILVEAVNYFEHGNYPFSVSLEKPDTLVARWKWMDARFYGMNSITDEVKNYEFRVRVDAKGKYHEHDNSNSSNVHMEKGKVTFGSNSFSGMQTQKNITIGFGKNRDTNESGKLDFEFDTSLVKKPIRDFLNSNGLKKALF